MWFILAGSEDTFHIASATTKTFGKKPIFFKKIYEYRLLNDPILSEDCTQWERDRKVLPSPDHNTIGRHLYWMCVPSIVLIVDGIAWMWTSAVSWTLKPLQMKCIR